MAILIRGGVPLHYRVSGRGPFVALQHALTNDHRAFEITGLRQRVVDAGFTCVTMDSVGHGKSGISDDPGRYALAEQALDLLAVMADAGAEEFSAVGYSMGAWLVSGAAATSARVKTAILGGWDPLEGARRFTRYADDKGARSREFARTVAALFASRPGAAQPSRPQADAFQHCYQELFEALPQTGEIALRTRLCFFCGEDDPYRTNAARTAKLHGLPFETVPGDHIRAFTAPRAGELILNWLDCRGRTG